MMQDLGKLIGFTALMQIPFRDDPDALAYLEEIRLALKELEALKAEPQKVEPVVDIDTRKCGNCGHALEHQQLLGDNVLWHEQYNYCPECGRKVKWDG